MNEGQDVRNVPSVAVSNQKTSWGTIFTLIVIVGIIVIGAFYVWGERISEEQERSGSSTEESTER